MIKNFNKIIKNGVYGSLGRKGAMCYSSDETFKCICVENIYGFKKNVVYTYEIGYYNWENDILHYKVFKFLNNDDAFSEFVDIKFDNNFKVLNRSECREILIKELLEE